MSKGLSALQLYRRLLCEARGLPHPYLRDFYRLRIQDEFRRQRNLNNPQLIATKLARGYKELRVLQAANTGRDVRALERVLDHAYGRRGVLKHELFRPLLEAPQPGPIVAREPDSRPPPISPTFASLVQKSAARGNRYKVIKSSQLLWPPSLPERSQDEQRALGPVPKRRELNARWRFFRHQISCTLPPLEALPTSEHDVQLPLEGVALQAEVHGLAGTSPDGVKDTAHTVEKLPTRFLRRRYASLLRRLVLLNVRTTAKGTATTEALIPSGATGSDTIRPIPMASKDTIDWWHSAAKTG